MIAQTRRQALQVDREVAALKRRVAEVKGFPEGEWRKKVAEEFFASAASCRYQQFGWRQPLGRVIDLILLGERLVNAEQFVRRIKGPLPAV